MRLLVLQEIKDFLLWDADGVKQFVTDLTLGFAPGPSDGLIPCVLLAEPR